MRTRPKLYLASTSPRRAELLRLLGVPFDVVPPDFEEQLRGRTAGEEALYFAEGKARSVVDRCSGGLILGSDTLIECGRRILGKPASPEGAVEMLRFLSGKTHLVHTAAVLMDLISGEVRRHLETPRVTFHQISDADILDYVATGEPLGKAGAYAIQGSGARFIQSLEGERDAVIGLPLLKIREWLV